MSPRHHAVSVRRSVRTRSDSGKPGAHVAEAAAAAQDLAHDQERQTPAQEIERAGDRAKLTVALHAPKPSSARPIAVRIPYRRSRAAPASLSLGGTHERESPYH